MKQGCKVPHFRLREIVTCTEYGRLSKVTITLLTRVHTRLSTTTKQNIQLLKRLSVFLSAKCEVIVGLQSYYYVAVATVTATIPETNKTNKYAQSKCTL